MTLTSNSILCNKFECEICERIYKRKLNLAKHAITIKDANIIKLIVYDLPEKAIKEM